MPKSRTLSFGSPDNTKTKDSTEWFQNASPENAWFLLRGLKLAAHFYHPTQGSPDRSGASIVISHSGTSVREQSPANYARLLRQVGCFCHAFDAAYQGESEGEPRNLEDSYQRVEGIKSAVTFLIGRKEANPEKIGVAGNLCIWRLRT